MHVSKGFVEVAMSSAKVSLARIISRVMLINSICNSGQVIGAIFSILCCLLTSVAGADAAAAFLAVEEAPGFELSQPLVALCFCVDMIIQICKLE